MAGMAGESSCLQEGGSPGRASGEAELQLAQHVVQQEDELSRAQHNLLLYLDNHNITAE